MPGAGDAPASADARYRVAQARSLVVLEDVANVDNIGSAFRNAAAFGVDGVVLSQGCGDPLYRKAIRTSMAATLRVPFAVASSAWLSALARLRQSGFQIVALTLRDDAVDLDVWTRGPRADRIALLLGAEGSGLRPDTEANADVRVKIPIGPDVDSLNLAVAAGIALHAIAATARGPRRAG